MNFSKKSPEDCQPKKPARFEKFENSSGLFMQLGLVLALFMVYVTLQYASPQDLAVLKEYEVEVEPLYEFPVPNAFIVEKKQAVVKQVKQKIAPIDQVVKVKDDVPTPEDIFEPEDEEPQITIDELINDQGLASSIDEAAPILFISLEDAPVFPGCEGLEKEASKACFTKAMTKFVNKNFRSSIAEGLRLEGRQRITVMFTINKSGLVDDVLIKAPHKSLENEARRVVEKLPQMIPGMQQKRPVAVKYTLPIVFDIQ